MPTVEGHIPGTGPGGYILICSPYRTIFPMENSMPIYPQKLCRLLLCNTEYEPAFADMLPQGLRLEISFL